MAKIRDAKTNSGAKIYQFMSPSVLVQGNRYGDEKNWRILSVEHSFIKDGMIEFLGDCTHKLAGQTVDLPEF